MGHQRRGGVKRRDNTAARSSCSGTYVAEMFRVIAYEYRQYYGNNSSSTICLDRPHTDRGVQQCNTAVLCTSRFQVGLALAVLCSRSCTRAAGSAENCSLTAHWFGDVEDFSATCCCYSALLLLTRIPVLINTRHMALQGSTYHALLLLLLSIRASRLWYDSVAAAVGWECVGQSEYYLDLVPGTRKRLRFRL